MLILSYFVIFFIFCFIFAMPKQKGAKSWKLRSYTEEFPDLFHTDGGVLFCKPCEKGISATQRFQVIQHISTAKHEFNVARKKDSRQQLLMDIPGKSHGPQKSVFYSDLCRALIFADIPLWKLNNVELKKFLEKYTNEKLPEESTLRKNYLPNIYQDTLAKIRTDIGDHSIWVTIDETTDVEGRYIGNVIVGVLTHKSYCKPHLIACEVLEKSNHQTIAKLFNDAMGNLWPEHVHHERVHLLVSDAAPYMIKAGDALKVLYPKMIHLTCLAHGIQRVAEKVRLNYPDVDSLISSIKKIFVKAPSRVQKFKEICPGLPLPPEPILTRWGTWLDAAIYYSNNIKEIKIVVNTFDPETAAAISSAHKLFKKPNIDTDLAYIKANFSCLRDTIELLEATNVTLVDNLDSVEKVILNLSKVSGNVGKIVKQKLDEVLAKNPGYQDMKSIASIICGKSSKIKPIEQELSPGDLANFKYAPITSCDVERSFSRYKALLADNRCSFVFENLKMTFVTYCYGSQSIRDK